MALLLGCSGRQKGYLGTLYIPAKSWIRISIELIKVFPEDLPELIKNL